MLAPNLYDISKKLMPVIPLPLRVFEIGSCFRKESEGRSHLKEFTMLNLVEWGLKEEDRIDRLKELAKLVLDAAEITGFQMTEEDSVVYGRGLDVVDVYKRQVRKGARFICGGSPGISDMRHGSSALVGCPEAGILSATMAALGRKYGIPTLIGGT